MSQIIFSCTNSLTLPIGNVNDILTFDGTKWIATENTVDLTSVLASYVSSNALTTALSSYVSSNALTTALSSYVLSSALTTALSSYVSTNTLTTALSDYTLKPANVTLSYNASNSINSVSTYTTRTYTVSPSFITGVISEIAYSGLIGVSSGQDVRLSYTGSLDAGMPNSWMYYYRSSTNGGSILFTPNVTVPVGCIEIEYWIPRTSGGGIARVEYTTDGTNYTTLRTIDYYCYATNLVTSCIKDYFYNTQSTSLFKIRWMNIGKNSSSSNYSSGVCYYIALRSIV